MLKDNKFNSFGGFMIKKKYTSLVLVSLVMSSSFFSCLNGREPFKGNLPIAPAQQQPAQQQLEIPQDYFILGTDQWSLALDIVDENLNNLYGIFNAADGEHLDEAEQAYATALRAYFATLIQDLNTVNNFFNFSRFLDQDTREEIANRLLTVVVEHDQFFNSYHVQCLVDVVGYAGDDVQEAVQRTIILDQNLRDMLPHEADDEMEYSEEEGD